MKDNNDEGGVYGFVTTGKSWQMLKYDGVSFQLSEEIVVTMGEDKNRWLRDCSVLVDSIYAALSKGGIVEE
jgi:hypothetical protein